MHLMKTQHLCWLAVTGPSSTLLWRRAARVAIEAGPAPLVVDTTDLLGSVGLGDSLARNGMGARAMARMVQFDLVRQAGRGARSLRCERRCPPCERQVCRLPPSARRYHEAVVSAEIRGANPLSAPWMGEDLDLRPGIVQVAARRQLRPPAVAANTSTVIEGPSSVDGDRYLSRRRSREGLTRSAPRSGHSKESLCGPKTPAVAIFVQVVPPGPQQWLAATESGSRAGTGFGELFRVLGQESTAHHSPAASWNHPRVDTVWRQRSGRVVRSRSTHRKQRPGSVEKALPYIRINPNRSGGPVTPGRRTPRQTSPGRSSRRWGPGAGTRHQGDVAGHGHWQGWVGHCLRRSSAAVAVGDAGPAEPHPSAGTASTSSRSRRSLILPGSGREGPRGHQRSRP